MGDLYQHPQGKTILFPQQNRLCTSGLGINHQPQGWEPVKTGRDGMGRSEQEGGAARRKVPEARAGWGGGGSAGCRQKPPELRPCACPCSPFSLTWQCPGEGRASPERWAWARTRSGDKPQGPGQATSVSHPHCPQIQGILSLNPRCHMPLPPGQVSGPRPLQCPREIAEFSAVGDGWGALVAGATTAQQLLVGSLTPTIVSAPFPAAWATPSG